MPRRRALLSAIALACASSFAQAGAAVDLDAPGALAMLARERPEHYATIQRVLREADRRRPQASRGCSRPSSARAMSTRPRF
jgi:hypothetical protein